MCKFWVWILGDMLVWGLFKFQKAEVLSICVSESTTVRNKTFGGVGEIVGIGKCPVLWIQYASCI